MSYDGAWAADPVRLHAEAFGRDGTIDRSQAPGTIIGGVEIPAGVGDEVLDRIESTARQTFVGSSPNREVMLVSHGEAFKNHTVIPRKRRPSRTTGSRSG